MTSSNSSNSFAAGRKSNTKKGTIMNITTRAIHTLVAVIAALLIILPASAAPASPVIPPELIPIGEPQSWTSPAHIQDSHSLEIKDVIPPAGKVVYAELKVWFTPDTNNGIGNERSLIKTSIGDFVCEDADKTDPTNSAYLCVHRAGAFQQEVDETKPFHITIIYAGDGQWGDSHGISIEITFYTVPTGSTFTTTSTTGHGPNLTFDRKNRVVIDHTPSTTPDGKPRPTELPNTSETSDRVILLAIGAIILAALGVFLKIASRRIAV